MAEFGCNSVSLNVRIPWDYLLERKRTEQLVKEKPPRSVIGWRKFLNSFFCACCYFLLSNGTLYRSAQGLEVIQFPVLN